MPAKKKDDDEAKAPAAVKSDPQGHAVGGVDVIPTEKDYDPGKHANHSHFNP